MIFGNGLVGRHALSGAGAWGKCPAGSDQVSRWGPTGASPELRKDCDGRHGHYQMNDS